MRKQSLTIGLVAALGLSLAMGSGCAKKDIQASAGSEFSEPGTAGSDPSGSRTGRLGGQSQDGFSEQDVAGGGFGSDPGQEPFSSTDLVPGGPGGGPSGSSGSADRAPGSDGYPGMGPGGTGSDEEPFPPIGMAGGETTQGSLSGFDQIDPGQSPQEDRITDGTMIAKADTSGALEPGLRSLQEDQAAIAVKGLEDVFFAYDSWRISDEAKDKLNQGAVWLKENPGTRVTVEGHCDARGSLAYNLVLGEKRAKAVRNYLVELGVSPRQFTIVSYGKERPFCVDHDDQCYQLNRRGHIVVR